MEAEREEERDMRDGARDGSLSALDEVMIGIRRKAYPMATRASASVEEMKLLM